MNYYIAKHCSDFVRENSRSGGVFTAISDLFLEENGVVYGCILNENGKVIHSRASSKEERDKMRGSKYVQSDLQDTIRRIYLDLKEGKKVLFSGTPCQVEGVKRVCGKNVNGNLICVDILCHGVPSPLIWDRYLKYNEERYGGSIEMVDFRNKRKYGWKDHMETIVINKREHSSSVFTDLFYGHNVLRESCFQCPYKKLEHNSDITIADAWGIETYNKEFNDNKGVSLVFANNPVGEEALSKALENCFYQEIKIEQYLQGPLKEAFPMPPRYQQFWTKFYREGYKTLYNKRLIYSGVKRWVKKLIRVFIPV